MTQIMRLILQDVVLNENDHTVTCLMVKYNKFLIHLLQCINQEMVSPLIHIHSRVNTKFGLIGLIVLLRIET